MVKLRCLATLSGIIALMAALLILGIYIASHVQQFSRPH
jgi:hypothetical protein